MICHWNNIGRKPYSSAGENLNCYYHILLRPDIQDYQQLQAVPRCSWAHQHGSCQSALCLPWNRAQRPGWGQVLQLSISSAVTAIRLHTPITQAISASRMLGQPQGTGDDVGGRDPPQRPSLLLVSNDRRACLPGL